MKDSKYFKPVTNYWKFITSDAQQSEIETVQIQYSKLRHKHNYDSFLAELRERNITNESGMQGKRLLALLKEDEGKSNLHALSHPLKAL